MSVRNLNVALVFQFPSHIVLELTSDSAKVSWTARRHREVLYWSRSAPAVFLLLYV